MHLTSLHVVPLALLAAGASADTFRVEVGKSGLKYTPEIIKADKGDIVEFHFDAMHTVVAGDFKKPCTPGTSGGFYSGVMPSGGKSFFSITINNTDPIFFYCAITGHCQAGMVGVINQGPDTLSAYKSAAANTDQSTSPQSAFGGTPSSSSSSQTGSQSTATTAEASKASGTGSKTTAGSAASASSSNPAAAGHLASPIAGVTCLALIFAGMLAL